MILIRLITNISGRKNLYNKQPLYFVTTLFSLGTRVPSHFAGGAFPDILGNEKIHDHAPFQTLAQPKKNCVFKLILPTNYVYTNENKMYAIRVLAHLNTIRKKLRKK